jgi:hypothetical protein
MKTNSGNVTAVIEALFNLLYPYLCMVKKENTAQLNNWLNLVLTKREEVDVLTEVAEWIWNVCVGVGVS